MDSETRVQILAEGIYISHSVNTLEKVMNPIILHREKDKNLGRLSC